MIAAILLFVALITATVVDIRKREIPDTVHILLLASGAASILLYSGGFLFRLIGLMVTGIILLAVGIRSGNLGGGDIKMGACLVFAMGFLPGLYSLLAGFILAASFAGIRKLITGENKLFPLAPFLSVGGGVVLWSQVIH